ncbi:MAG: alpha/beta fold hydrolase [Desulfovibrionales bacterium]|nr:alpha/beta fold hydrolase [Desulfovibrionales bacterium]
MVRRIINGKEVSTKKFESLYPFESQSLNCNGHNLHYVDQGKGEAIVMVHGNPTWSFYYRHMIQGLSKNFRTIAPDHIGCGFSDKPGPGDYEYTLASRIKDLDTLIQHTVPQGKINLMVHDWGGMIGLAWALEHLDRVGKIIITNTAGFFLPKEKRLPLALWMVKHIPGFGAASILGLNGFVESALLVGAKKGLAPSIKSGLRAPYNSWRNRMATLKFVQDIPLTPADPAWALVDRVSQNLDRLSQDQLLLLWGARDFVFDLNFYKEFKKRFPKAQSQVFETAGHYLFEDEPKACLERVQNFLLS